MWIKVIIIMFIAVLAVAFAVKETSADTVCGAGVQIEGTTTGDFRWCDDETVVDIILLVSVHYPSNANPCGFDVERGPSNSWYEVPNTIVNYIEVSTNHWEYSLTHGALCGGENSMRVTVIIITEGHGATAWAQDFGTGAYGVRTESFKPTNTTPTPTIIVTPTPSSTVTPTPTKNVTPSPTVTTTVVLTPTATPSATITATPEVTGSSISATPVVTPSALPKTGGK